jgi:hypothetical protein
LSIEFTAWPKTPRLFRDSVITEKIDGTNGAIGIIQHDARFLADNAHDDSVVVYDETGVIGYQVYAQSRNRIVTPGADNYGFAAWVHDSAEDLIADLGVGLHFGEWWGQGINRGYGMDERYFSLFNTAKWAGSKFETPNLAVVPVIDRCTFNTAYVVSALDFLGSYGSFAAPGFARPEGVCVYHTASGQVFKALLENDSQPKSLAVAPVVPLTAVAA